MNQTLIERAVKIIIANEGNYASVNINDNGAVSVGKCQWHGNRAKYLLHEILLHNVKTSNDSLQHEIMNTSVSWENRIVTRSEAFFISRILNTKSGRIVQDAQAEHDVSNYLQHCVKLGFGYNENILIFLADIENQGGAGASARIAKHSFIYSPKPPLETVVWVALQDKVF
jgi:hypothetical protein